MAFFIVAGYGTLRCGHIKRWAKRRGVIHHIPSAITPLRHRNRFIILNQNAHTQGGISIVLFLDKHLFIFGVFANNIPACCKYGKYEAVL